jgi:hypothetical protein
LAHHNFVGA